MKAKVFFDGACLPYNPGGIATFVYVIKKEDGSVIENSGVASEKGTNNLAEYTALIKALENAIDEGIKEIEIFGDSQLVVYQINGIYSVKSFTIIPLYNRTIKLLKQFDKYSIKWIPKEQNQQADNLSTKAYLKYWEEKIKKSLTQ